MPCNDAPLLPEERLRDLGVRQLVAQVQSMIESTAAASGFNADDWVAKWLRSPLPALGGSCPEEYMGTLEGQARIRELVARMESGAYS